MLRSVNDLQGYTIHATDGDIGSVDQFYFDDELWVIRYLVADTGNWLPGRKVLITPISLGRADWGAKKLYVTLTKKQVENSPDIDTHKPVSRQYETAFLAYYGYPYYWGGTSLWGPAAVPASLAVPRAGGPTAATPATAAPAEPADVHLRSTEEVTGYHIQATDGEVGHVEDFIVDDETWAIRYIGVDTRNWWPGKKVFLSPRWIARVSWEDSKVYVDLLRETIKNAPEYDESAPITREYEIELYDYYGRPAYWR
jgi:hypothetical protein